MPTNSNDSPIIPKIEIDKLIHEPARLIILATLYVVDSADFLWVERQTGLTRGNLSSHMSKLDEAGYIEIEKMFVDKIPRTLLKITGEGKKALLDYIQNMRLVMDKVDY